MLLSRAPPLLATTCCCAQPLPCHPASEHNSAELNPEVAGKVGSGQGGTSPLQHLLGPRRAAMTTWPQPSTSTVSGLSWPTAMAAPLAWVALRAFKSASASLRHTPSKSLAWSETYQTGRCRRGSCCLPLRCWKSCSSGRPGCHLAYAACLALCQYAITCRPMMHTDECPLPCQPGCDRCHVLHAGMRWPQGTEQAAQCSPQHLGQGHGVSR